MTQSVLNQATAETAPQAWLASPRWDLSFIIAPAFVSSIIALVLAPSFANSVNLPLWAWVSLVLMVDVAHVYASLFRTYLDKKAFQQNKTVLCVLPIACWAIGSMLYSIDALLFWKALAYLAVFHFIRQQYGFVVLYSRKQPAAFEPLKWLDHALVYSATIYPMLYWHTHLPRNFTWFVDGDFFESMPISISDTAFGAYALIALAYFFKELWLLRTTGYFNIPKNALLLGTAISWWVGIIAINSDMAFTLTNVVSHGIPYMALIWLFHHQNKAAQNNIGQTASNAAATGEATAIEAAAAGANGNRVSLAPLTKIALTYVPAFLLFLIALAYLEEGLWDGFIWREHLSFFQPFAHLPEISDKSILAILIPFLALPQSTHYALDGFIWRVKDTANAWSLWRTPGR